MGADDAAPISVRYRAHRDCIADALSLSVQTNSISPLKASREPKYVFEYDDTLYAHAHTMPLFAPALLPDRATTRGEAPLYSIASQ